MYRRNGMYHCQIHFYLLGYQSSIFETIKGMSPLAHFTHQFSEGVKPDGKLTAAADVILMNLKDMNVAEAIQAVREDRKSVV